MVLVSWLLICQRRDETWLGCPRRQKLDALCNELRESFICDAPHSRLTTFDEVDARLGLPEVVVTNPAIEPVALW